MKRASASAGVMPASPNRSAACARSSRHVDVIASGLLATELPGALVGRQRVDDVLELAFEHTVQGMLGETDAVVGHPVVLVVVRADLLGPTAALHLLAPRRTHFRLLPLLLDLQHA